MKYTIGDFGAIEQTQQAPVTPPEFEQMTSLIDKYIDGNIKKVQVVLEFILGPQIREYGINEKTLKMAFFTIGTVSSMTFIWSHVKDRKVKVAGVLAAAYIARLMIQGKPLNTETLVASVPMDTIKRKSEDTSRIA